MNRRLRPTLKSAVLSHYQNRRFYLIIKIGGFVPFSKSAVLSHSKIGGFVSHPLHVLHGTFISIALIILNILDCHPLIEKLFITRDDFGKVQNGSNFQ